MSWLDTHEEALDFIELIRHVLGKRPLPDESWVSVYTLDGERSLTTAEWVSRLGISRQAVSIRRQKLNCDLAAGVAPSVAYARASQKPDPRRLTRKKTSGRSPGLAGPCLASRSDARVFEAPVLGAGPRSGRRGSSAKPRERKVMA